ncbi:MAG: hypothetical protein ABIQ33_04215, partial [Caldimonas sp.]
MSADEPSRPASVDAAAATGPRRSQARRVVLWSGAAFAAIVVVLAFGLGALIWSAKHPAGSAWVLGFVPGLTVVEPKGSLVGDFSATRVVYVVPGVGELRLDAPRWHALAAAHGDRGRWLHLVIDTLHADRAVWIAVQSTGPASTGPQTLRLPIE